MRFIHFAVILVQCFVLPYAQAERWSGAASPLDGRRLIVLRPAEYSAADEADQLQRHKATVLGSAVLLDQPRQASFFLRSAGKYSIWVRVGQATRIPTAIRASLSASGKELLNVTFRQDNGSAATGGPAGYSAYRKLVEKYSSKLAVKDDLADDILGELGDAKEKAQRRWSNLNRIEDIDARVPFYWWKLGTVELKPGDHTLRFAPQGRVSETPPLLDAAFLTTFGELPYPFQGDLDAQPASYVRFKIDSFPPDKKDLSIRLGAQLHHAPWGAGASLAPGGINHPKPTTHSRIGYTRWYRLQDIENFSNFGPATLSIRLNIDDSARGATEFAIFPHDDYVLRRFDWNEPDGKRLSMRTDFETYPQDLRTLRDYAREHYQSALWATGNQIFPLTRGPLYFTNGSGGDSGTGNDYMVKTLRLLGFNSCAAPDNDANSRRYGWMRTGGHYWPPAWLPYDEAATLRRYREHYASDVAKRPQAYEKVGTFQIADEPQEINTTELSAPFWLYQPKDDDQPDRWHDPTGSSELISRRTDLRDCVLEGMIHCGAVFEIRVGQHEGEKPTYGFWRIGRPNNYANYNVAYGVNGGRQGTVNRPGAAPSNGGVPFKLVYQSGKSGLLAPSTDSRTREANRPQPEKQSASPTASAVLYCNGRLMARLSDLPPQGGFVIRGGNEKSISQLQIRAIAKKEQLLATIASPDDKKKGSLADDLLDDLKGKADGSSTFASKPLKEFVEQDWQSSGGLPEAHVGFRKWLRERGLTPQEFGKSKWDEVRVMTIRELADSPERRRLYYWSRRYANYLTPRMFAMAAEGIRENAPNKEMKGFVALSGHALYLGSTEMPLDMFELARYPEMTPGVSDWMSSGGWRWDSHQAVAYSVAPFNAGGRQYGKQPLTFPMMHCVYPSVFRAYTQLANQCKLISYWTYGPSYSMTEGFWSDSKWSHHAVHKMNNRSAQVDDILGTAVMRPSRVAMLYSHSTHIWSSADSYHDKRATFLGLSHEYFQPELVTEQQINSGCLQHYDALYVLEPHVSRGVQSAIAKWTQDGGLLWTSSNSLTHDEYNEPHDWLFREAAIQRTGESAQRSATMKPADGQSGFQPHSVYFGHRYKTVAADNTVTRATYDDGTPAWIEKPLGKGRVVYVGHRAGVTYSAQSVAIGGRPVIWADTGRVTLTRSLHEAAISRELVVSKPTVMATAQSTDDGTVIVLYNMQPEPLTPLKITLTEKARPAVVQLFEQDRLIDTPFQFADGKLTITLDRLNLNEGQMIVVRRNAQPADSRSESMKVRVTQLLKSDEPLDLSAGAWFAGFHGQWNLADSLLPLLNHQRWEVRRSSAEAIGRLRHLPAGELLSKVLKTETDDHARADQLHALALINPQQFLKFAPDHAKHDNVIVRLETLRAIKSLLDDTRTARSDTDNEKMFRVAQSCASDAVESVRHLAIATLGQLKPSMALAKTLAGIQGDLPRSTDWLQWAAIVASHDEAFADYLDQNMPGGDELFFEIAQKRRDAELAKELESRLARDIKQPGLMQAIEFQRNERLMRLVFARRAELPTAWQSRLAYQLETTFQLGLGRDLSAWAKKLKVTESD